MHNPDVVFVQKMFDEYFLVPFLPIQGQHGFLFFPISASKLFQFGFKRFP